MGSLTLPRSMVVGPRDVIQRLNMWKSWPAADGGHVPDAAIDDDPRDALATRGATEQLAR